MTRKNKDLSKVSDRVHHGHRKRLRSKFLEKNILELSKYEILELALCYCVARGDVNPLAHRLIDRFQTLTGVLNAKREELLEVDGVGDTVADFLTEISGFCDEYVSEEREYTNALLTLDEIDRGVFERLSDSVLDTVVVAYPDCTEYGAEYDLVENITIGQPQALTDYVEKRCNDFSVKRVVICHSHQCGSPLPSDRDRFYFKILTKLLAEKGITIDKFYIVSEEKMAIIWYV